MATLLPPPKRVKVYHGVPEPELQVPTPSHNIVVQFVSEDDGKPLAPAVNLPSNVSREGLEALVNKLSSQVSFACHRKNPHPRLIDARTMNRCHFRSMCRYLQMPRPLVLQQGSSFRNRSMLTSYRIQRKLFQKKIYSFFTV